MHNGQPTGAQGTATTETGAYTLTTDGINNNTVVRNADWKWAVTSEDEWYKAAYYKGGSTNAGYWNYPTRNDTTPGQDLTDASGNNANYHTDSGAWPIDAGRYTTVVGQFQNSASPYGTFDQGGNVWEWNEAVLYDGVGRGLRGSSFGNAGVNMCASDRIGSYPSDEIGASCGFRVAYTPEPATLGLMAVGVLAVLRRKRVQAFTKQST